MAFDYKKEYKEFYMPKNKPSTVPVPSMNYIAVHGKDDVSGIDYAHKENFKWISVIRLPDFVTKDDFEWAVREATEKKKIDFSKVEFLTYDEGLCVQCMHVGSYDEEPKTVALMHEFMEKEGYVLDITDKRMHHEIYLSDARRIVPEKLKTVIRHPIRKVLEVSQ